MAQIPYIDIKQIFLLKIIQIMRMFCTGFLGLRHDPNIVY